MRSRVFILGLVLLVALGGCKKGSPIVGTWHSQSTVMNLPAYTDETFNADGTFSQVTNVGKEGAPASLVVTDKGTWTLEGDKLTEKLEDTDWQFSGPNAAKLDAARSFFQQNKAQIIKDANKEPTVPIKWEGEDKYTFTRKGETTICRRKK